MAHKPGDKVEVRTTDGVSIGIVMPNETDEVLFIKLESGYNIGISKEKIKTIDILEEFKDKTIKVKTFLVEHKPNQKNLTILHTGGTIASRVDYRTGAVVSQITPEEILREISELKNIVNLSAKTIFQVFSEDFETIHWTKLAEKITEVAKKSDGIIVGMGTDTMEYAAAALSFALQGIQIPVLLVGSQRSSDRPSSDAGMNLICAAQFIVKTNFKGIAVCMHETDSDNTCYIIEGHHVKKMHTSRRDTFRPINKKPIARVNVSGKIEKIRDAIPKDKFELKSKFSSKVGLVKIYPGFKAEQLDAFDNYDGLVVEGYAFGQLPINQFDEHTKHHPKLLEKIKKLVKKIPVVVVSQRPYGLVNMNVYSTSRDLLEAGVIEAKMQSHVAYAKLCWLLGQNEKNIKELMQTNISGEIVERVEENTFLI